MKFRILVVDDEVLILHTVRLVLATQGYAVAEATSASEALALLVEAPPDLAIVDLGLPESSGLDLLGRIKEEYPELPVIILTGQGEDQHLKTEALARGAAAFLGKPLTLTELFLEVDRALRGGVGAAPPPLHHPREGTPA